MKNIYYILLIGLLGCTKSIVFELPEIEQTIVVEATVESGLPPRVILTNSQGYFEALDSTILSDIFIHDADVVLSDGVESFSLQEINFNGVYFYTSLDLDAVGQFGKTYSLSIEVNDKNVYSTTTIPHPLFIDSLWFDKYVAYDSLGLIGAKFSDPDTLGNCYRWFAQRINSYTYNYPPPFDNVKGTIKDWLIFVCLSKVTVAVTQPSAIQSGLLKSSSETVYVISTGVGEERLLASKKIPESHEPSPTSAMAKTR